MTHRFECRVYYEDTDLAGIVYYANYLKFIERARSEFVRELGIDQVKLRAVQDIVFVVRRLEADFLSPARFDDQLSVETTTEHVGGARIVLHQRVLRGETVLFSAVVTLVCVDRAAKIVRIPANIRSIFG